jgi:hypothetical protein
MAFGKSHSIALFPCIVPQRLVKIQGTMAEDEVEALALDGAGEVGPERTKLSSNI